jgi:signal transduction histidine kinase/ligand-binding sensor domain-containing protein
MENRSDSLPSNIVRCLLEDSDGNLWVGTAGGGLARHIPESDGFIRYLPGHTVRTLFQDSKGRLWIGTENQGVFLKGVQNENFQNFLKGFTIRAILEDDNGKLWLGTESHGIAIFDPKENKISWIRKSSDPKGLTGNWTRCLYKDRSGLIWIGTRDAGINRYNPLSIDFSFLPTEETPRQIYSDTEGRVWFGTDGGGLHQWIPEENQLRVYQNDPKNPNSLSNNLVYCIVEDTEGTIWVGTDGGGLNALREGKDVFEHFYHNPENPNSLGSNNVWALTVDSKGTLWVGTELGGLCRYDPATQSFRRYRSFPGNIHSLNGNSVRAIVEDSKGNLWIGTWDGGLSYYRPETDDFVQIKRIPGDPSSLGDNSVNCLFEDKEGVLWVGTSGAGLNRRNGETNSFLHITKKDGLAGDNVFGILQDENGCLWISTEGGLSRFDTETGIILSFSEPDGLQKNEFAQKSFGKRQDGTLFFGGPRGISYFSPSRIRIRHTPPPLRITNVLLFDEPVPVGRKIHGYTALQTPVSLSDRIDLSWKDSVLSFHFAVLDYTDPERNHYAMKIEGLQKDWTYLGSQNSALVTALRPGKYVLRVKGANHQGVWNESGISLNIIVHPPFWDTPLFRILFFSSLIFLAFFFYRFRTYKLEQRALQLRRFSMHIQDVREEERKNAAREIHDGLGQYLAVLKMDVHWLRNHLEDQHERLQGKLKEMIEVLEQAMDGVKDFCTRLRPQVLDHFTFLEALRWQVQNFKKYSGIPVELQLPQDAVELGPEAAKNLFRVLQEILTNILKHAGAEQVKVILYKEDSMLKLIVEDNGRGISLEEIASEEAFGIIGIRERCSYLNGSVEIIGSEGKGTQVTITIPLEDNNA